MKSLLFVNRFFHPDQSATSQMLSDLVFELGKEWEGNILVVTSRQNYENPQAELPGIETIGSVTVHRTWSSRFGRHNLAGRAIDYLTFYASTVFALLRLSNRQTLVIAKTDPPMLSFVAALACRLRGAKLINWLQDMYPEIAREFGLPLMQGPVFSALRAMRNWSLRNAEVNVVIGEKMAKRCREETGPATQIEVIHNWADSRAVFPIAEQLNPLRKDWKLAGRFVTAYSGNLGRGHDFSTILEAAKILEQQAPAVLFLIIGGGIGMQQLEKAACDAQLRNIIFKPYQPFDKLSQSLSAADVHLVSLRPSMEGLMVPSKFYGIAAAGRPMLFIGSPFGEVASLLKRYECGVCVDQADGAALAAAIRELAGNPGQTAKMGSCAYEAFIQQFDRPIALDRWRQLLYSKSGGGAMAAPRP